MSRGVDGSVTNCVGKRAAWGGAQDSRGVDWEGLGREVDA